MLSSQPWGDGTIVAARRCRRQNQKNAVIEREDRIDALARRHLPTPITRLAPARTTREASPPRTYRLDHQIEMMVQMYDPSFCFLQLMVIVSLREASVTLSA